MSKFSHYDDGNDDAADAAVRAMTIPRRFLRKQPSLKSKIGYVLFELIMSSYNERNPSFVGMLWLYG